jgi:hypothetical protein
MDILPIVETQYLKARYYRALIAWNFAVGMKDIPMATRQAIMIRAYDDIKTVRTQAPGYLEVQKMFTEMEKARNVRPKQ